MLTYCRAPYTLAVLLFLPAASAWGSPNPGAAIPELPLTTGVSEVPQAGVIGSSKSGAAAGSMFVRAVPVKLDRQSALLAMRLGRDCVERHDCIYRQSLNTLELSREAILSRLSALRVSGANNHTTLKEQIGDFCITSQESADQCLKRYALTQRMLLAEISTQIALVSDSIVSLSSDQDAIRSGKKSQAKKAQLSLLTQEELRETERANGPKRPEFAPKLQEVMLYTYKPQNPNTVLTEREQAVRQSVAEILKRRPQEGDFVEFKEVDRNPGDPSMGKIMVVAYESDGKTPKKNRAAFLAAMKDYEELVEITVATGLQKDWIDVASANDSQGVGKYPVSDSARENYEDVRKGFEKTLKAETAKRRIAANDRNAAVVVMPTLKEMEDDLNSLTTMIYREN